MSTRPAQLLIHDPACNAPRQRIGPVWMMPAHKDAIVAAMEVARWLVYALDSGWSVQDDYERDDGW